MTVCLGPRAARRDIGYPDTGVTGMELAAMRISDFYDQADFSPLAMTLPFDEVCNKLDRPKPRW